ncbi:MAG: ABC transporter ATP-binding protein [Gemmatimonadota bacterium]
MIRLEGLTKRFGGETAVDGLDLEVEAGELVAMLGRNGAGKTTALRTLAGILRPDAGRAIVAGHDVVREPERARAELGYVPDRPFVYEKVTGRELLRFVAGLHGLRGEAVEERIDELLDLWDLTERGDRLVESYSHGMRQKLIISSALVHRPQVLVVDEPMVGMDPQAARVFRNLVRSFAGRGGTVLISTHTLEFAEALADRLAVVDEGRLLAQGTMEELRRRAETERKDLEEIFLRLTGDVSDRRLARVLA